MTSLVNTETGEIVEAMSVAEAEVVTDQIAWRLDNLATAHEEVMPMIREALTRRAWEALGYRSPGEYAAERFGGALTRLSIPVRQAVVQELTDAGMSTRAIAPVVGVSKDTVHRDIAAGVSGETPRSPEGAESIGRKVAPSPALPPRSPVTGIDGKSYRRPEPVDRKTIAEAAIGEFPDLAFYSDQVDRVVAMAGDLRRYRERGELDQRLDYLRRSIAVDRADRDGIDTTGMTAVMNEDGIYEMQPMPIAAETSPTCPTCGQTVRN